MTYVHNFIKRHRVFLRVVYLIFFLVWVQKDRVLMNRKVVQSSHGVIVFIINVLLENFFIEGEVVKFSIFVK